MANPDINRITFETFESELQFSSSRSSGPGGQNVNKVNTRIELRFHIRNSKILSEEEEEILLYKLKNKINKDGELIIISQEDRSQFKNKTTAIIKFLSLLMEALAPVKNRKATKPSKTSVQKRLNEKKLLSEKKIQRKRPDLS